MYKNFVWSLILKKIPYTFETIRVCKFWNKILNEKKKKSYKIIKRSLVNPYLRIYNPITLYIFAKKLTQEYKDLAFTIIYLYNPNIFLEHKFFENFNKIENPFFHLLEIAYKNNRVLFHKNYKKILNEM